MAKEKDFISLKEASEMSGYTADYLGQLIRSGKLEGKQVFLNVAWVTTKDAVEDYLKKNKKKQVEVSIYTWPHFKEWLFSVEGMSVIYEAVTWSIIVILGVFILFLAYVFAVNVDNQIERNRMERWEPPKNFYEDF